MYCPRCGQQASPSLHYCKSCGFSLDEVSQLLGAAGERRHTDRDDISTGLPLEKYHRDYKGFIRALVLGGITVLIWLFIGIQQAFGFTLIPAASLIKIPVILLAASVLQMFYAFTIEIRRSLLIRKASKSKPCLPSAQQAGLGSASDFLVEGQGMGPSPAGRVETGELVQPPSVTEHTTKLLERQNKALRIEQSAVRGKVRE